MFLHLVFLLARAGRPGDKPLIVADYTDNPGGGGYFVELRGHMRVPFADYPVSESLRNQVIIAKSDEV